MIKKLHYEPEDMAQVGKVGGVTYLTIQEGPNNINVALV